MQNSIKLKFYIPIIILIVTFSNEAKSNLNVVSSIKPIHSITAAIMDGVSQPTLIVDNTVSPHSFNLKPSHIEAINGADLIFYVSEDLETFLEKPLNSINKQTNVIEFIPLQKLNERPCFYYLSNALGLSYKQIEPISFDFNGKIEVNVDILINYLNTFKI